MAQCPLKRKRQTELSEYEVVCRAGVVVRLDSSVVERSTKLQSLIEDLCPNSESVIQLPRVSSMSLELVKSWCIEQDTSNLPGVEAEFLDLDDDKLIDLIMTSNVFGIEHLTNMAAKLLGKRIAEQKTPEEIRKRFGIVEDLGQAVVAHASD